MLNMTLYSYSPFGLGYRSIDNSTSVKGFLRDVSGNPIENREILIYVNDILMGKANTDYQGCFYFNNWNNTKLKPLIDSWLGRNPTIPTTIKAVFPGDNNYSHNIAYNKDAWIRLFSSDGPAASPAPFKIVTKQGSGLEYAIDSGESTQFPIVVASVYPYQIEKMKLSIASLPCSVYAVLVPNEISMVTNKTNMNILILAKQNAQPGNYTLGLVGQMILKDQNTGENYTLGLVGQMILKDQNTGEKIQSDGILGLLYLRINKLAAPTSQLPLLELAPLKQLKTGIATKDVICQQGFVLILKGHDGLPACVKPSTQEKLLTHGWVKSE